MPSWSIHEAMDDAARECSITPPDNWLTTTDTTELQFLTFLRAAVDELLNRHAWSAVSTDYTFNGPGSTFALPSDFWRVAPEENALYETSPMRRVVDPMPNRGDWTETVAWNWTGVKRYYRLRNTTIEFIATLPNPCTIKMAYVQNTWAQTAGGSPLTTWTNLTDISLLPGPLLRMDIIWRWRRHKGIIYADRKAEFETEFARYVGDDAPRRKVDITGPPIEIRHPMRVPVPDFIPSA